MSTEQTPEETGYGRGPLRFPMPPGAPETPCRSCGAPMVWTVLPSGRKMPLNPDGTSHFSTCPDAREHRKQPKPDFAPLTPTQLRVLRLVHDGIAVPVRNDNRFALSDLERRKLIVLEHGLRWRTTEAGALAAAPKKPPRVRT